MIEIDNFSRSDRRLELWGGLECTIARIGDGFRDQSLETGHRDRLEDLDRIAAIGMRTLRYPFLWESISPTSPDDTDFAWHDARMARMRELGLRPIAGLCHHGSGPAFTNMLDPRWPELLARHAGNVARRYPDIDLYTPVNEPLTTARFSCLYGHWYPHETGYGPFLRGLINQCKAVVLSMREIRKVRLDARLVQTDDLGKTFSHPALSYQADHENERRWLTFDLLCGMVDRHHPWWRIFADHGISEADLSFFLDADAAPDVIGINHYLTSERYLDPNLDHYADHHWGGNGRHRYADVEAIRMPLNPADLGPAARLRETWERYGRPVAVTEAHHGCTRDEQLRWLSDVWQGARQLRQQGADIRAVTVWALFGTVDWNTLLTERNGSYEPGPFDGRAPQPRPTALADAAKSLAHSGEFDHPILDRAGWWKRDSRFYRPPRRRSNACRLVDSPRQILITGATGTLGRAFSRICNERGLDHVLLSRQDLDIANEQSVEAALDCHKPWAVINAAGYVRVDDAEREPERCLRENAEGAAQLARACAVRDTPLVAFSSDLVFNGRAGRMYVESDPVAPAGVYGASKAEAERQVLAAHPQALVVRTSAFFGPWDRYNFVWWALSELSEGRTISTRPDLVTPTYVPDLAHEVLNLLIDGVSGIWHLANPGAISWSDFARKAAVRAGLDSSLIIEAESSGIFNTALSSERGIILPPLDNALNRYFGDVEIPWSPRRVGIAAE